ncbi:galactose-3-O-sulfotransferase 2-like [Pristis pectinata]|uniref:galactose-3-O-sulfotransferase 2-like n=1 Tax=Pristis pectinata TaxID=685728 RepID=UPI00223CFDCE|nr:galactose-3-O-sulfotransferase 2-like [Pristis pectinata]
MRSLEVCKCSKTQAWYLFLVLVVITTLSFTGRVVYLSLGEGYGISLDPSCKPRRHVVFLKTHKTASSTILNILYRYGEARNLTFALPFFDHLGYPQLFKARYVKDFERNPSKEYNIICNHMRFNLPEVRKVMPNQSVYFTILRNPDQVAESSFSYYHDVTPAFREAKSLDRFASRPSTYYSPSAADNHYARNLMWFDLGGDHNAQGDPSYVNSTLQALERAFDLVLLAEYFDESLVLLREALCWPIEDMAYFRLNARLRLSVAPLAPAASSKLRQWNSLDWSLYSRFNRSFWERVARYGAVRMERDVSQLREIRRRLGATCLRGDAPAGAAETVPAEIRPPSFGTAKILGYVLRQDLTGPTRELCTRMVLPESRYLSLLQRKQALIKLPHNMENRL